MNKPARPSSAHRWPSSASSRGRTSRDAVRPIPILFLHGEDDRTISVSHSQRLYALAREPKRLVIVPECGHLEVFHGPFADQNRSLLEEFFLHALRDTGDVESSSN